MKLLSLSLAAIAAAAFATDASAQSRWRFSTGYTPMIGLRTEFSGFGNYPNPFPALPAPGPGQNYFYFNGSVQVDSTGNAGGQTTFFSYNDNAQFDGVNTLSFNGIAGGLSGAGSVKESDVASAGGFQLSASLDLGTLAIPSAGGRSAVWGIRVGGQYNRVESQNNQTIAAGITTITDAFNTGVPPFNVPPGAPYVGPFNGPGSFLLGDTPVRTFGNADATITGGRKLDVHLAMAQFGTYVEIPIAEKFDVMLESGFILALATGSYQFDSSVAVPGGPTQTSNGYERRTRLLPGFYAGVGLTYHLTERLGLQAAARYQFLKEFEMSANGSTASLAFNTAFTLSLSAIYKF